MTDYAVKTKPIIDSSKADLTKGPHSKVGGGTDVINGWAWPCPGLPNGVLYTVAEVDIIPGDIGAKFVEVNPKTADAGGKT